MFEQVPLLLPPSMGENGKATKFAFLGRVKLDTVIAQAKSSEEMGKGQGAAEMSSAYSGEGSRCRSQ